MPLEPCPFCHETHDLDVSTFDGRVAVHCLSCGARGPYLRLTDEHTQIQARHEWNSRTSDKGEPDA